jgi:hypothetical protein
MVIRPIMEGEHRESCPMVAAVIRRTMAIKPMNKNAASGEAGGVCF